LPRRAGGPAQLPLRRADRSFEWAKVKEAARQDFVLYLTSHYNPWGVVVSVLIGTFASYVALDLAQRVHGENRRVAALWWLCGSLAMGTGIWSMHFVGMLSFSLPIALGYAKLPSLLSWIAAVMASAVALRVANGAALSAARLLGGALAMGGGICSMHYLGMAALDMTPAIVWDPYLVATSAAIAVCASAAALLMFFWLRAISPERLHAHQLAAAVVMGVAISGMHYTGMAAASFPAGSMCLSAGSLSDGTLSTLVVVLPLVVLALTLGASMINVPHQLARSSPGGAQLAADNQALRGNACLDSLTGMPNRVLFEDRLAQAVARLERAAADSGARRSEKIAVLFVDLDGFKPINDSFGHGAGDSVLLEVSRRLARTVRASDTAARLGGDEFVLLMEHVHDMGDCQRFADRLLETLAQPFEIEGQRIAISTSVGIALYPDHGEPDELLTRADAAMNAAKRAGRGNYTVFEPHMDAGGRAELALQNDLRHAVERGELQLLYQPKIRVRPGEDEADISGVEALIRWHHPQQGLVGPAVFIPLAERMGLINNLGEWVIEEACRQMRAWADEGLIMPVAINLSLYQLRQQDLGARIQQSLARHRVAPAQLLCEITESAAMEDIDTTLRVFADLAKLGVYLSIDDFGTGYSSLSYLRRLPARQLKIDRSFVTDLESNTDAQAVVHGVIKLAHALDLSVVAEGVETQGQQAILRKLECDELQGFLFSEPMPAAALRAWITQRRTERVVIPLRPRNTAA
jgi:diguanylate cyclase